MVTALRAFPTRLVKLVKCILLRKAAAERQLADSVGADYDRVDACENQLIAEFLRPAARVPACVGQ